MKKSFVTWRLVLSASIFSLMMGASLNAMIARTLALSLLAKGSIRVAELSPLQSLYLAKGKEVFLQDLSKGVIPSQEVPNVARLFTHYSCMQVEDYKRIFSGKVANMNEIRAVAQNRSNYEPVLVQLNEEFEQESFEFAQTAVDIDPSLVCAVVDLVPSVLNRQGIYFHGYGMREGTLLDYVEDEITEVLDANQLARLKTTKNDLLERGAKRLRELHVKK